MHRIFLVAASLVLAGTSASAAQDRGPGLEMLGLAPGLPLSELQGRVAKLGARLSCKPSPVDRRFSECTATVGQTPGRRWELRASVVDSASAVILLRSTVSAKELEAMRTELAESLGRPNYRKQGGQTSFEWVRGGSMMRLTSRAEKGVIQLSVSLVDGKVLDALNAGR